MTHTNTTENFGLRGIVSTSDEVNEVTRNWIIASAIAFPQEVFAGVGRDFGFVL
jgi:hypothetical protein